MISKCEWHDYAGYLHELHHIDEVANRGDVYNVDNLCVNTILTYTGDL
ncbi:hypothetical protein [Salmonella enterica]